MSVMDNVAQNGPIDPQNAAQKSNPRLSRDSLSGADSFAELSGLLAKMKAAQRKSGAPDYDTRIEHLDKLERSIIARKHDIAKAIGMDFGVRSKHESLIA
ncbi:MAG: Aldehyde dehydrogenase [Myxococcaceae bacterium]|nr:Aldehyde dehydrogenase [Myxococcaceae bacterium]